MPKSVQAGSPPRWHRPIWWCAGIFVLLLLSLLLAGVLIAHHLQPLVRARLLQAFQERFHSAVSMDDLQVHYNGQIQVDGRGLRVQSVLNGVPGDPAHPMLQVQEFHFHLGLLAALSRAPRVHHVRIRGVQLDLPAQMATQKQSGPAPGPGVDLEYAEVDDAHIHFATSDPNAAPFVFDLPHLVFRGVSRFKPIRFHAVVDNGAPIGITESDGTIGPWNFDDPRLTPIAGTFWFGDKDVSSVRGLRGKLTLNGKYDGTVGAMHTQGTTDDPSFGLDVSSHPVDLRTRFDLTMEPAQSMVTINRLQGSFDKTEFVCTGAVVKDRATQSFRLDVQLSAPAARVEDALVIGTRTAPPLLRGTLSFSGRMQMRAGPESVSRKLSLQDATFHLDGSSFNNPEVQQMLDELAERARGNASDASAGRAVHVAMNVRGTVSLQDAVMQFSKVQVILPGAELMLHGNYSLPGTQFALDGNMRTDAKLSQMTTGVESLLLKPFNHLLGHSQQGGAGATLPLHIRGVGNAAHIDTKVAGVRLKAPGTN